MFHLIEPELDRVSGGLRYNRAMVDAADQQIMRHQLRGSWPEPTDADIAALQGLIEEFELPVLVDGLIGCSLPEPLSVAVPVVQLLHAIAKTDEARKRERDCLQAADAVVTTSQFAADALAARYGLHATVAVPGVVERAQAAGEKGSHFICVGAVEPNKNQMFLAETLYRLHQNTDAAWHCTFAGPVTDPTYANDVRIALKRLPTSRAAVVGELDAEALAELYHRADLLLLPSRRETFGMVVCEAAAAGIPALVAAGTGAEEALGAGYALELDEQLWSTTLHRWITDAEHRSGTQGKARQFRQELDYGWGPTAQRILWVLREVS